MIDGETAATDAGQTVEDGAGGTDAGAPDAVAVAVAFAGYDDDHGQSMMGADLVVQTPEGTSSGDLLVVSLATSGTDLSDLGPYDQGWSRIGESAEAEGPALGVWARFAGGPDTYYFGIPFSSTGHATLMRFAAAAPSDPVVSMEETGGLSSAPVCPSTPGQAGALLVCLGAFRGDAATSSTGLAGFETIVMSGDDFLTGGAGYRVLDGDGDTAEATFGLGDSMRYRTMALVIAGE